MRLRIPLAAMCLLAALCPMPRSAQAAPSYDNCAGFVDSLPAVLSKQGVWCLRHDLSTNITNGEAIIIGTNNVTLDCNDFKIGGLAAGPTSIAVGIYARGRQNAVVRHCGIRGFLIGINLVQSYDIAAHAWIGGGHLVEDNRLDSNYKIGINVYAVDISTVYPGLRANNLVRRNRVFDTGGIGAAAWGIRAVGDIIDNVVDGVSGTPYVNGIDAYGVGTRISGNRIGGLTIGGTDVAYALSADTDGYETIVGNHVAGGSATLNGVGIGGTFTSDNTPKTLSFCKGNTVIGYSLPFDNCLDAGSNYPDF